MILTDEEMGKIDIPLNICKQWMSSRRYADSVAAAQLRKVVEWGEETCPHDLGEGTQCYKHACDMCWQSLKEEAGL